MSMLTLGKPSTRRIPDKLSPLAGHILSSWEVLLFTVAIAIFIANSLASLHFLDPWDLSDASYNFTEKAMIAFAMTLLIVSGEIDLSGVATAALASTVMGAAAQAGFQIPALVGIGLGVGLLSGAFNGLLVARISLPSIVVPIGTMRLFRGIAQIVLGDRSRRAMGA